MLNSTRNLLAFVAASAIFSSTVSSAPAPQLSTRAVQAGAPAWASAKTATIHPGVNTETAGGSCTSNFIYYNKAGDVFIGQAAHCSSTGESSDTNGCSSETRPEGTQVTVTGASKPGTMVYNSWARMQAAGEKDANTCAFNDLALVKLDPADYAKVNPSIPVFGGPTGIRTAPYRPAEPLYSYGNSVLRRGFTLLSPKYGTNIQTEGDGWSHVVLLQFGIPGDSGSAGFDGKGRATGVLSTLQLAPIPTANGFGDFSREFNYLRQQAGFSDIELALGTEAFAVRPPKLG